MRKQGAQGRDLLGPQTQVRVDAHYSHFLCPSSNLLYTLGEITVSHNFAKWIQLVLRPSLLEPYVIGGKSRFSRQRAALVQHSLFASLVEIQVGLP